MKIQYINIILFIIIAISGCGRVEKSSTNDVQYEIALEAPSEDNEMGPTDILETGNPDNATSSDNAANSDKTANADNNEYTGIKENEFHNPAKEKYRFSTFGIDVDTASYSIMRQYIEVQRKLPPGESVRIEEYINYFDYELPLPAEKEHCPFSATAEVGRNPWAPDLLLARIGIKGREVERNLLPPINLVFLIDVSGSMDQSNKLPLVKESLEQLVEFFRPQDSIGIVTYAGSTKIVLSSVSGQEKTKIIHTINNLQARGGTFGSGGIELAYQLAEKKFKTEGLNRIILCSDGDFNIGRTGVQDLTKLIEQKAKTGIFLTVLGFGMGNFKDNRMEMLADRGNGNYAYIDNAFEAKRILVNRFAGTLMTIAKDVKIQVDFNPDQVKAWRLVGYENRVMAAKDFNNDKKDSGDIGAGHSVVALYEIVPQGVGIPMNDLTGSAEIDKSRYTTTSDSKMESADKKASVKEKKESQKMNPSAKGTKDELFLIKLRYKLPDEEKSSYKEFPVNRPSAEESRAVSMKVDFRFTAATALYAMILRESQFVQNASLNDVEQLLSGTINDSQDRKDFLKLVKKAQIYQKKK